MRAYVIISYPSERTREQWEVCAVVEHSDDAVSMGNRRFPRTERAQAEAYAKRLMSEMRACAVQYGD